MEPILYTLTPKEKGEALLMFMRDNPKKYPDTRTLAEKSGLSEASVVKYIRIAGGTLEKKTIKVTIKKYTYKLKRIR